MRPRSSSLGLYRSVEKCGRSKVVATFHHLQFVTEMLSLIAMLGLTNQPTCGVEDYCTFLGRALAQLGIRLDTVHVHWSRQGWVRALLQLRRESATWRGKWVVVQYTAGGWSRYGFPFCALIVMAILRHRGVCCAVTFHEPYPWETEASDPIQRLRSACQGWVIRRLYHGAAKAIFADPLETIDWLRGDRGKATFIPIGANVPEPIATLERKATKLDSAKTVAVFCLSETPTRKNELDDISAAIRFAASEVPGLRLRLIGKGTEEASGEIERAFEGSSVKLENLGVRSAEEVSRLLSESDAMLCVRGQLFPRRGSAMAGIACGVPIIAYAGPAQDTPLADTGIEFVPWRNRAALGLALVRVLKDEKLQSEMRARSRRGQDSYFSWDRIARRHVEALASDAATPIEAH